MPFVSIEGIDGSGKTLQAEFLAASLRARNLKVLRTKEPDGGWIGLGVRSILTAERPSPLSPQEEMLLISAARFNHVRGVIRPALVAGNWVVTDRFVDSTFAFQVYQTGVSERAFEEITAEVVGNTMPNFTFILDIDADTAVRRRNARGGKPGDDPAEATRNFARIRNGYLEMARRAPRRCYIIDATATPSVVADRIMSIIVGQPAVDK
ncbi:Thymidylate kinase [Mesorhizobium plurifarium]|uniref:Thymidylate kinase n=1 Tax=Mesorhizobium plurifarium TaxID=69974 RepID=A0A090E2M5_MESPL|nr:Thymidylate kinase [Mesorhizobium plurifarium]